MTTVAFMSKAHILASNYKLTAYFTSPASPQIQYYKLSNSKNDTVLGTLSLKY